MSSEQAQRAIQQLYDDSSTRDELTDDEAAVLLKWGESRLTEMGRQNMDDSAFDEAFTHLRRVVMNINRYTGQRSWKSPQELQTTLDELFNEAKALGVEVQAAALTTASAQAADDNIALIEQLTAMVTPERANSEAPAPDKLASFKPATHQAAPQPPPANKPADDEKPSDDDQSFFDRLFKRQ